MRDVKDYRMFQNEVLRRIFRPKRNEVTGDWRKFHLLIFSVIKSMGMRWVGHVACTQGG
jgi:hypothetical protein